MKNLLAPVALLAARSEIPPPDAGDSPNGCASGLYIIAARGTGELPGIGAMGSTVGKAVVNDTTGSKIVAVNYPASLSDPDYLTSVANGTDIVTQLLTNYRNDCPGHKVALMGYSQGAQAIMDALCGSGSAGFNVTQPIPSSDVTDQVVAVALYGDPTHVANVTFDTGTSVNNGIFARNNTDNCLKYAPMIHSWCDTGDIYCDSGKNTTVHGQYIQTYMNQTVDFIVDKYKAAGGSNSSTSPSSSSGSGPSATTSGAAAPTTSKPGAAAGAGVGSMGLYLGLPIALLAMLQML